MPSKQCVCLILWIASETVVERPPSSINCEIDASANFEWPPVRPFLSDSNNKKYKICSFRSGQDLSNDILGLKIDCKLTPQWLVQSYRWGSGWPSIDRSLNASYADFGLLCLTATTTKMTVGQVAAASKYSQNSPRVHQSSPQVRKSLVSARKRRSETR